METKTCHVCGDERPVEEFRLRSRNGEERHNNCKACWCAYMREYNRQQRHKELTTFNQQLKDRHNDVAFLAKITQVMVRRMGGLSAFVASWKDAHDAARKARPGSKMVLDFYLAVTRLIEVSSQPPDYDEFSDEDLELAVDGYVRRVLGE